jgi:hypothetical protein
MCRPLIVTQVKHQPQAHQQTLSTQMLLPISSHVNALHWATMHNNSPAPQTQTSLQSLTPTMTMMTSWVQAQAAEPMQWAISSHHFPR